MSINSVRLFLWGFISSPLSLVLIAITVAMLGSQYKWWEKIKASFFKQK